MRRLPDALIITDDLQSELEESAMVIGARFRRPSFVLALTTVAAVAIVAAASGSVSSANSAHAIRFTLVQNGGFFPKGPPKPGAVFGFVQRVRGDDGSRGVADVLCTLISASDRFCNIQFNLSFGQLALQGVAHPVNKATPMAVVGGTGAYAVARGKAAVTDVSKSTTRITVTLAG